jgi:hypothetical protein
MTGTGAVVAKIKGYPTHTSLGAGSIGALLLALQSRDWIAASVAAAGLVPPIAIFVWHVGARNVVRHLINGDQPAAADTLQP